MKQNFQNKLKCSLQNKTKPFSKQKTKLNKSILKTIKQKAKQKNSNEHVFKGTSKEYFDLFAASYMKPGV